VVGEVGVCNVWVGDPLGRERGGTLARAVKSTAPISGQKNNNRLQSPPAVGMDSNFEQGVDFLVLKRGDMSGRIEFHMKNSTQMSVKDSEERQPRRHQEGGKSFSR